MEKSKEMVISKKGILFLCTGNSCRSQMAEGFAKKMLPKNMGIFSAGLEPKGIHPMAVKIMQEVGIYISQQKSKNISEIPIDKIGLVVALCGDAAKRCPIFPGKVKRIHWAIEDLLRPREVKKRLLKYFAKYAIK